MTPESHPGEAAPDASRPAVIRLARRLPRPVIVVLAIASIILGVVLLLRPTTALDVLALLIGGGLVLGGLLELLLPGQRGDRVRMVLSAALIVTRYKGD